MQIDSLHWILSSGYYSQSCVNIIQLQGTAAYFIFTKSLFNFTTPKYQKETLSAISLSAVCTAPLTVLRLFPSSVCLIENSIQLTSNMYWAPLCWQQSSKSHRGYKISIKHSLYLQIVCMQLGLTWGKKRPTWDRIYLLIRMYSSDIKCIGCSRTGALCEGHCCRSTKASWRGWGLGWVLEDWEHSAM